ncbi:MAG: mannose-6-phosphate isomerase [Hoeflea sp.]|uniref:AGE family epimerase/isomerase n=1 Tax=Hoeflea sp. TaxID=1940281 RepID=UPI000C0D53F8|nr:AGE family epimerase/isomerase [Hoeflea sp.]PHR20671.1 MAG: mannose-6-phosphate isomerase [Hoeflea sp.]
MSHKQPLASATCEGNWRDDAVHQAWLLRDAVRQLDFFRRSLRPDQGFDVLEWDGTPRACMPQELHFTTRLIHSYALASTLGDCGAEAIIDAGMDCLWNGHRDTTHGGYVWSIDSDIAADASKLAYGHVFVLLAGASARQAGHPDADRLIDDVTAVIDRHFWDDDHGLLREEFNADWSPLSSYRGMNANMHGVEALLAAFEATGREIYLDRAGRILDFFVNRIAPEHHWRIPEHYSEDWQLDRAYAGNPMFRPAGTTPGHSLEFGRLLMQHWDLAGRPEDQVPERARKLIERALDDAWLAEGGLCYTLDYSGEIAIRDRYWWPVAEAIGAISTLQLIDPRDSDETWYRKLWRFAEGHFIDHDNGGWYPELDEGGGPVERQFHGKPDVYHSLQAVLLPLAGSISRPFSSLRKKFGSTPN